MSKKYALTIFFSLLPTVCLSDTTRSHNYQSPYTLPNADTFPFPTHDSLLDLAKNVLQKSEPDGGVILSCLDQFIAYANVIEQPQMYLRSTFKLFSNKLKSCDYINPYQLLSILDQLFIQLDSYVKPERVQSYLRNAMLLEGNMFDRFQAVTNNLLYAKFSTEYETFKQDPDLFLEHISHDITQIAQEEVKIELMRQSLVRFLEISLSKLVWSPAEQEKSWDNVKRISNKLAFLVERNILTDVNDLDDLFWSLIHRYCFFLDITSGMMPSRVYQAIRDEISSQQLILLELEEQDDFVERKGHCLNRTLIQAEIKTRAQEQGILIR